MSQFSNVISEAMWEKSKGNLEESKIFYKAAMKLMKKHAEEFKDMLQELEDYHDIEENTEDEN